MAETSDRVRQLGSSNVDQMVLSRVLKLQPPATHVLFAAAGPAAPDKSVSCMIFVEDDKCTLSCLSLFTFKHYVQRVAFLGF